jgi:VWFA-related protein
VASYRTWTTLFGRDPHLPEAIRIAEAPIMIIVVGVASIRVRSRSHRLKEIAMSGPVARAAALLAASFPVAIVLAASQAQPPSFVASTRTVAMYATVTNAQGRLVPDLARDDFTIDDNGKRQTLTLFANEVQPITVIMLLDRSGSMKPNFALEEQGAEAFVREMLPADRARIGSFSTRVQIDPDEFTSDREALLRILRTELQDEGPTPLWNAVDIAIDKLLLEQGRRVILVFTDGVDRPMNFQNHNKSLKDVMKRAEEENVMVYAIGLAGQNGMSSSADTRGRGNRSPFGGMGGGVGSAGLRGYPQPPEPEQPDEGLPKIAAATGGGYFELKSVQPLPSTFAHVADELHHQYALGFTPESLDGKMHDLTLHLRQTGLTARARKRYLASKAMGRR